MLKYYRFMKDAGPMEQVEGVGGVMVPRFRKGDYLSETDGGKVFCHLRLREDPFLADMLENVERLVPSDVFRAFLRDGVVVEAPQNIRDLDLELQREEADMLRRFSDAFSAAYSAATSDHSVGSVDFRKGEHMKLYGACKAVQDRIENEVERPLLQLVEEKKSLSKRLEQAMDRASLFNDPAESRKENIEKA